MTSPDEASWRVLYDRDCGFCRWTLSLLLRADRDRLLRPVALQSPEAAELLADCAPERRLASWHLVGPDGRRRSGGEALPTVVGLLPGGRPLAALLGRAQPLTNRAYVWVAEHRTPLSRPIPARAKDRATRLIDSRERGVS